MGIIAKIKAKLKSRFLRLFVFERFICEGKEVYSQEGEDLLLEKMIGRHVEKGFFVDIGAHHPIRFSNTYLFYKKGWRGINIDAMPGSMNAFEILRPEDINLEIPVSDISECLTYYIFNYPELNTFEKENAQVWNGKDDIKVIKEELLTTVSLTDVLSKYLDDSTTSIDILSIDVEGMDFKVLKSIDLIKCNVKFIIIEEVASSVEEVLQGQIYKYLKGKKYKFVSKLDNSTIYKKDQL